MKRVLVLILVLITVFTFASCDDENGTITEITED